MVRFLNIFAVFALVGSAIYAYSIKYETIFHAERIVKLKHEIKAEQDEIAHAAGGMGASDPPRAHSGARRQIPRSAARGVAPDRQRGRLPERAAKTDAIGEKLGFLGLAEPTRTPHGPGDRRDIAPAGTMKA